MPSAGHFLPVWLLHVIEEVYHTAIDAPTFPQHHLRYGPKEIRGTRDETDETRDPIQGGDPESLHHVFGGKMYQHECCRTPASLYTNHMYMKIRQHQRARSSSTRIPVAPNSGLCSEIELWLQARSRMNGASWYDSAHHPLSTTGASDASSSSWAGVVHGTRSSGEVFRAAADFPAEWVSSHINVKETFALYEVLRLLVEARPDFLRSSSITMDADNKALFYELKKGRAPNEQIKKV